MDPSVQPIFDHFESIPWCKKHLDRPDQHFALCHSRRSKRSTQYLFDKTFNTPDTLPHFLVFYDHPQPKETVPEVRALITLGKDVAGHKGVCHGGMVMSLLDEVAGELAGVNQTNGAIQYKMLVTAYLNTKFNKPLMVPSTVFAKSWVVKTEGRKFYVEVVIEDENGVALASADSLFVAVKEKYKI